MPSKIKKNDSEKNGKEKKSPGQLLSEKLLIKRKNAWEGIDSKTDKEVESFARSYMDILDRGKTEREFSAASVELLKALKFKDINQLKVTPAKGKNPFPAGTKIYNHIKGKALLCAIAGKKPISEGVNILGAHIDSPRLDLKPNPLYEDKDFALLDTHYYGGIKKYQWTTIPLAMHGVFIDSEGKEINICIGEDDDDPVFTITDLLIHLAQDQMQKKGTEVVEGEDLDVLVGSRPYNDEKVKEKVKLLYLSLMNKKYGIGEGSFSSAEIEFVPAHKARDIGLDRSMIGGYGHDDRCCAYPALRAIMDIASSGMVPDKTLVLYFSDKEEIGSVGNTGAQSWGFENFIAALAGEENLRTTMNNSVMLSTDVAAAVDPAYANVFDKRNSSYMGKGLVITKYTGSGGKRGASDANSDFCARVEAMMDRNKIPWQTGTLGRVDKGGGGTIALHAAKYGIDVIDCGISVLSMHSPFEVISKIDLYTAYKAYMAFLKDI